MNKVSQIPERPSRASLRRLVEKLLKIDAADLPLSPGFDDLNRRSDMLGKVEEAVRAFATDQSADIGQHVSDKVDHACLDAYDIFDTLQYALKKAMDATSDADPRSRSEALYGRSANDIGGRL